MKRLLYIFLFLTVFSVITAKAQVYYLNENSKLTQLPKAAWSLRFSNFGSYEQGGIRKEILVIEEKSADTELPSDGVYFFVKNDPDLNYKGWKLVSMEQKKDRRELPTCRRSIALGDKNLLNYIPLNYENLTDDIILITPKKPLKKGEYLLVYQNSGGELGFSLSDHSDFSVTGKNAGNIKIPSKNEVIAVLSPGIQYNTPKQVQQPIQIAQNDEKIIVSSDVDSNIPDIDQEFDNTFALIISNENYKYAEDVPFALNDGKTVKKYFTKTLGIPQKNITHLENATLNDIKFAMNRLGEICSVYGNDARLLVYYSGHGVPDEASGDAFLLPTDGYATDPSTALKMGDLYDYLNNLNTNQAILFTDACFSGAQRSTRDKMIASARGVAIKAKNTNIPQGNLIVFSAAQGDQTALPYESKSHGLMTYFLLKKLQEGNKNLTLGELSDYIIENVKKVSVVENKKSQTPNTASALAPEKWRSLKLR